MLPNYQKNNLFGLLDQKKVHNKVPNHSFLTFFYIFETPGIQIILFAFLTIIKIRCFSKQCSMQLGVRSAKKQANLLLSSRYQ